MGKDVAGVYEESIKGYLQPIWDLLQDESVTEVMINGHDEIFIETGGKLKRSEKVFPDEDSLMMAVVNIAQSVGRRIDDENPRLDARLPNGYRIHAVIPPLCKGTTVAIRKFSTVKLTFKDYIKFGTLTPDAALFLDICMKLGKNVLVSGGTGSGKTTLLSVLCSKIPPGQRIIVIEDSAELQIDYEHIVFFETRMANGQGKGAVTIEDLLKSSLRLRPDRIIVGEVRGGEALDLIQAMNTGHKGCLGTVHSNSEEDAMVRLEALAQGAESKLSEQALQYQIGAAVDIVVQISRMSDGSRKITGISEVLGLHEDGTYNVLPIFRIGRLEKQPDGKLKGGLEPQGNLPTFMEEIEDNRLPFPRDKFRTRKKAA
ncbi:MAG: pilus assembly protein [Bdellovibrionaceae bacterium]|nr:pilus assembly protein [Pseudobdellovibrionaceae bacterium]|tara:strand:+ start:187 stop:1302 length:1116 start_codon:yes stop_codon:yes gene_type:complete